MRTFVILLLGAMVFAGCAQESGEDATVVADPVAASLDSRPDVATTEAGATAAVVLGDGTLAFPTDRLGPGPVVFTVQNSGTLLHTLSVEGSADNAASGVLGENLDPGAEATMQVDLQPGTYVAWCSLHSDEAGERVEFIVEAP